MKDETMIISNKIDFYLPTEKEKYLRSLQYDEYYVGFYNTFIKEREKKNGDNKN